MGGNGNYQSPKKLLIGLILAGILVLVVFY